jgi:hypothetical protein
MAGGEEKGGKPRYTRRLMIREMTLENFKSYAGPQHVGPFHKARRSSHRAAAATARAARRAAPERAPAPRRTSPPSSAPTAVARATSSTPCSSCSAGGPSRWGQRRWIDRAPDPHARSAPRIGTEPPRRRPPPPQLRFNKVSELIHNSSNHRNLEQARVIVYFQEIIDKVQPLPRVTGAAQLAMQRAAAARRAAASRQARAAGPPAWPGAPGDAALPLPAQEGDDYEVVPGSEFTVTRTANRNNTSDYYVNSKRVSTKEVTTLLKEKGIDLDNNRFLILQVRRAAHRAAAAGARVQAAGRARAAAAAAAGRAGAALASPADADCPAAAAAAAAAQGEVEQISLMKPKAEDKNETGLLEYLEDIIDTAKYIEPIEQESKKCAAREAAGGCCCRRALARCSWAQAAAGGGARRCSCVLRRRPSPQLQLPAPPAAGWRRSTSGGRP